MVRNREQVYGKQCRQCNIILAQDNTYPYYIGYLCKTCRRENDKKRVRVYAKEYAQYYYKKHKKPRESRAPKTCKVCDVELTPDNKGRGYYCKPCWRHHEKLRARGVMNSIRERLGGKCVHCGINDKRVLQIDHIYSNGAKERKVYGSNLYNMMKNMSDEKLKINYQLLCSNCNWIKRFEKDEHNKLEE